MLSADEKKLLRSYIEKEERLALTRLAARQNTELASLHVVTDEDAAEAKKPLAALRAALEKVRAAHTSIRDSKVLDVAVKGDYNAAPLILPAMLQLVYQTVPLQKRRDAVNERYRVMAEKVQDRARQATLKVVSKDTEGLEAELLAMRTEIDAIVK